jgi:predicted aconitase with swiveling domain
MIDMQITARTISRGKATGEALISKEPIGFLGGVDPETGDVIEKGHELEGKNIAGKVLIFPNGKGSTVGSYVMLQLAKNGKAPAAIINISAEPIIAVGAIISKIPMVDKPAHLNIVQGATEAKLQLETENWPPETEHRKLVTVDADKGIICLL